jgi:hypothetical protein
MLATALPARVIQRISQIIARIGNTYETVMTLTANRV